MIQNITRFLFLLSLFSAISISSFAQKTDANVFGHIESGGEHIPFANVVVVGTHLGTSTDESGHYMLVNLPTGKMIIAAKAMGFKTQEFEVNLEANQTLELNFSLEPESFKVDEVVVTGTKTFQRQTESPIIVNVLDKKLIQSVQACDISEGLKFQPGLRVETDCQTCSYSQLRMNGLGGGYSQILINGRPIFSPLIGLYGMEQIPASMLDRIEVVRGGGSAMYGSSAIGGTVNIITSMPKSNAWEFSYTSNLINAEAWDHQINGNISLVSKKRKSGAVIFVNSRNRQAYDHPGITRFSDGSSIIEKDNYSELPALKNNSFGINLFFIPADNQKIELNLTSLYEYRYGGELIQRAAHLAQQSEERIHHILMGGLDYQINFNEENSSFLVYLASQSTQRNHYTGIYPSQSDFPSDTLFQIAEIGFLKNPPYGYTSNSTFLAGAQVNHRLNDFFGGKNILSLGFEYQYDDISDSIPFYQYGIEQTTRIFSAYLQSDWKITSRVSLLSGARIDKHNLVAHPIVSPRLSLLYRQNPYTQLRLTAGTGFRAPQSFDTDMHIAFAGGGVSRIFLADGLQQERSTSVNASVNFDRPAENWIYGYTLESFYTNLEDAFYLHPMGEDDRGEVFEKRNGPGAKVYGVTIELRGNYNKQIQLESGFTWQKSRHEEKISYIDGLEPIAEFLRSPDVYGYGVLSFTPNKKFSASLSSVYTGKMKIVHYSPLPENISDEFKQTPSFNELSLKLSYAIELKQVESNIELFAGVKNIFNAYQSDFDNYKYRDSNYIYGPSSPRTIYIGIKIR